MFIPFSLFITIPILHGVVRVLPHYFIIHCKNVLKEENRKKEKKWNQEKWFKTNIFINVTFWLRHRATNRDRATTTFFVHHTCEIAYKTHVYWYEFVFILFYFNLSPTTTSLTPLPERKKKTKMKMFCKKYILAYKIIVP